MKYTFYIFFIFITFSELSCKRDKRDSELFFIQGNTAFKKGNYEQAIKYFTEAIAKEPNFADSYNNRGIAYLNLEKYDLAKKDFQKAIEIDGDFILAKYNLAEADYHLNNLNESIQLLKTIEPPLKDSAYFHGLKGAVLAAKNDFPAATSALNKAILLNKNDEKSYINLGYVQYQERNFDAAKSSFMEALKINPKQDFALNNLSLLAAQTGNFTEAEALIRQAIGINSRNFLYENNLSFYLLRQGKTAEAQAILDRLAINQTDNAWVLRNLGILNYTKGQLPQAKEYLQKADKLDPSVELLNYYLGLVEQKQKGNPCQYWKIGVRLNEKESVEMAKKHCN